MKQKFTVTVSPTFFDIDNSWPQHSKMYFIFGSKKITLTTCLCVSFGDGFWRTFLLPSKAPWGLEKQPVFFPFFRNLNHVCACVTLSRANGERLLVWVVSRLMYTHVYIHIWVYRRQTRKKYPPTLYSSVNKSKFFCAIERAQFFRLTCWFPLKKMLSFLKIFF